MGLGIERRRMSRVSRYCVRAGVRMQDAHLVAVYLDLTVSVFVEFVASGNHNMALFVLVKKV